MQILSIIVFYAWDFRRTTGWNGCVFVKPRPISPYMVTERNVDWQRAAAAELLRHGGGYSVTGGSAAELREFSQQLSRQRAH